MAKFDLYTTGEVIGMIGLGGILIAPLIASVALDIILLKFIEENCKNDSFYTGMLFGMFFSRQRWDSPCIVTPSTSFEMGLTIALSAIATACSAYACAVFGGPLVAVIVAMAWVGFFGLYLLGEGLKSCAEPEYPTAPVIAYAY